MGGGEVSWWGEKRKGRGVGRREELDIRISVLSLALLQAAAPSV